MVGKGYIDNLFDELDYTNGIVKIDIAEKIINQPLKFNLAKQTFELIPEIDSIYFSGEHPLIYFKSLVNFDDIAIKKLHKKIWNQGRVPLLFVSTLTEIRIYNCYKQPLKDSVNDTQPLEVDRFANSVEDLVKIKASYHQSQMDTGIFWETTSGKKISSAQKVDQLLVKNLKETRKKLLLSYPNKNGNALAYIHNLLGRSLFILYLQDRGIINAKYFAKFLDTSTDYFSLLSDKSACYELFKELNNRFNGDLFTVTYVELLSTSNFHLELIRKCFYGDDVNSGQLTIWRMYDFSFIPIELLSAIYEEFLHTEEGDVAISNQGAYYTPQPLVEFVLNEVLPYPDENNTNWELKILDPACGSGIFLVEAYRRLVERWKYMHQNEKISIDILRSILKKSIYGVEQNSEAIKVASFSLYLTILNYLEPKSIWANKNVRFPHLINSIEKLDEDQGHNLFEGDTFEVEGYTNIRYNLVIGNPPWKRGSLSDSLNAYIKKYDLGNEAVLPFLHKMAYVAADAKIALVSTAKILFNATLGYANFRKFFFEQTKVDAIVNFANLRKSKKEIGRKLFSSASGPAIVVFYNGVNITDRNDSIVYCVPKPQVRDTSVNEIIIDASDVKFVPLIEAKNPNSQIWKIAMWGTLRDYNLVKKLKKEITLKNYFDSKKEEWTIGVGFEVSKPKFIDEEINKIPFISNEKIIRYATPKTLTETITHTSFYRLGNREAFAGPHLLIKKGQSHKKFTSSYLEYECSFMKDVYGISSTNHNITLLKALNAFLNSSLASYFLFLTASSWGIERETINLNELKSLPAFDFMIKHGPDAQVFSKKIDDIISILTSSPFHQEEEIQKIEKEIEKILFAKLKLTKEEIYLIRNVIDFGLDFFQEGAKSKSILPTQKGDVEKYAKLACANMVRLLTGARTNFWAKTYSVNPNNPLMIMSFHFDRKNEDSSVIFDNHSNVGSILKELNKQIYHKHSESIYFRKVVKHYDGDVLFIVKPNEKRFWTEAVALEDSDNIAIEMIAQDNQTV